MKITPELLKDLGFEQIKNNNRIETDEWHMHMHGYLFTIKGGPSTWKYLPPGAYEPHSHSVTDIEEVFGFTYECAYESGKRAVKQEIREFLGVSRGC